MDVVEGSRMLPFTAGLQLRLRRTGWKSVLRDGQHALPVFSDSASTSAVLQRAMRILVGCGDQ